MQLECLVRFTSNPNHQHWKEISRTLRYLKYLHYSGISPPLECYNNADWATNKLDSKSTSGWVFTLGGGAVAWSSHKQTCVAISSMEFEYVALFLAGREAIWIRRFLRHLPFIERLLQPITTYCDNKSAIFTAKNKRYTSKSKHIAMKYNHIRRLAKKGRIVLEYLLTIEI